ncbi:MAG TPA: methyltransferase [Ignavibacteriaceae bacterium]|nr:methyltransferase [Ignavibacteriaceae bacterium]
MIEYIPSILGIIFLFIVFGFLHSILASLWLKKKLAGWLGNKMAFYRIFYNIFSIISLAIIYDLSPQPNIIIYDLQSPFDLIILIPQFGSLIGAFMSFKFFSTKEFLGIDQVKRYLLNDYSADELDERMSFRIEGPYRYCRHPVYFFSIMFLLFRPAMDLFYITFLVCIILYFWIGSIYEEKKLVKIFGSDYLEYQKYVPAIIPYKLFSPYSLDKKIES